MSEKITAHYLDVDRTATHGPTDIHTIEALVHIGAIDARHSELLAQISTEQGIKYIRALAEAFYELTHDVPEDAMTEAAKRTAERWLRDMYPEVKDDLARRRGDSPLLVISHGPDASIQQFGRLLGAAGAMGRTLDQYQRREKPAKLAMLRTLGRRALPIALGFEEAGNAHIGSAYGDSKPDIEVLRMAADPVVVNPLGAEMEQLALEHGWRIIRHPILPQYEFGDLDGSILFQS